MRNHTIAVLIWTLPKLIREATFLSENPSLDFGARIAARALATDLIPGCVGRGVRLGFESSSGAAGTRAGGVWKSGDLEIREF